MAADAPALPLEQTPGGEGENATSAPLGPASLPLDPTTLRQEVEQLEAQADIAARVATSLDSFGPSVVRHMHLAIQRDAKNGELLELVTKARAEVEADAGMQDATAAEKLVAMVGLVLVQFSRTAGVVAKASAESLRAQSNQMLGRAAVKRELLGAVDAD